MRAKLDLEIDYNNEDEVSRLITSQGFAEALFAKVHSLFTKEVLDTFGFEDRKGACIFCYGGFSQNYRVARGDFMTEQMCLRSFGSKEDVLAKIDALALWAVQNTFPLIATIRKAGGYPVNIDSQIPTRSGWKCWNEYDRELNPELLSPRWKLSLQITWVHPNDDAMNYCP